MDSPKVRDLGLLVIRLALAMVMMYHGSQKLFGLFGGNGLTATLSGFESGLGIPPWLGILAVISEFFGGLGIAVGLLTRVAAFGVIVTMGVAAWTHLSKGDPWNKVEFPLMLALVAVGILLTGAGSYGLDGKFGRTKKR